MVLGKRAGKVYYLEVHGGLDFLFVNLSAEAALRFLPIGTPPPRSSWGNILSEGRSYMSLAPWVTGFPGLDIKVIVPSLNLLGDALRDIIYLRRRTDRCAMRRLSRGFP